MDMAEPRAYEWDIAAGHAILIHLGVMLLILMAMKYYMEKKISKSV